MREQRLLQRHRRLRRRRRPGVFQAERHGQWVPPLPLATWLAISALGVTHRRSGYRDPESQVFIESWFRT